MTFQTETSKGWTEAIIDNDCEFYKFEKVASLLKTKLNLASARAVPVRTCVGCRARVDRSELVRVVVDSGSCIPDPAARLPGRGAWLHPDPACLDLAERRRAFPRALRVTGPLDLTAVRAWWEQYGTAAPTR